MIELVDLSVSFSGETRALDKIDLTIPDGVNTVVIGESGSGKSVMLSAILRTLPREARVTGRVCLDGTELLSLPERDMRKIRGRALAYIPQGSGNSLNPLLTVGFQIAEPMMEFHGVPKADAMASAVAWMRKLHLGREEQIARSYPHTLSGGMKQRALIAMGAAGGAKTLLADEPTKGLDAERTAQVIEVFRELKGRTMLCVSHDLHFVQALADRISVMYAAQQVEYCGKEAFFTEPLHPYSRMMLEALPENGLRAEIGFAPPHGNYSVLGCHFYDRCPHASKRCQDAPPLVELSGRKVRCWLYAN